MVSKSKSGRGNDAKTTKVKPSSKKKKYSLPVKIPLDIQKVRKTS